MRTKKTSLADIAMALGVSKTLVSMVLNGRGDENGISKKTQVRVQELADKLNYKPNQFARGLRLGRSNTIGLVVSDISNPFYAKIARMVEDKVSEAGYNLMICNSDESQVKEKKILEMLRDKQVDGIILSSTMDTADHIVQIHRDNIPLVLIDRIYEEVKTNQVMVDNRKGAENAVLNFLEKGHRNIALMVISPPHISTQVERYNGYCDALRTFGLPIRKEYVCIVQRENIVVSIGSIVDEWKQMNITPTALFVANNQLAQGCLESFRTKGIRIPDTISMISFDDVDLFRYANPPISSVRQPVEEIAVNAVDILMNDILTKNDTEPADKKSVCLQTEMIERLSVMKCS